MLIPPEKKNEKDRLLFLHLLTILVDHGSSTKQAMSLKNTVSDAKTARENGTVPGLQGGFFLLLAIYTWQAVLRRCVLLMALVICHGML